MEPLDPELRRLIRDGLPQALPSAEVEERVLRELLRRLPGGDGGGGEPSTGGQTTPATGTPAPATATRLGGGLKAALVAGSIAAAIVVLAAIGRDDRVPPPTSPPVSAARSDAPASAPVVSAEGSRSAVAGGPPGPAESAPEGSFEPVTAAPPEAAGGGTRAPVARARPSRRPSPRAAAPAPSPAPPAPEIDPLLDETRRVGLADAALTRGDFRRARQLAEELARAHPRGQLVLEREAIDICSRCGLGEPGAAAAAEAFLRDHAGTPVAARVHARCDDAIRAIAE